MNQQKGGKPMSCMTLFAREAAMATMELKPAPRWVCIPGRSKSLNPRLYG